MAKKASKQPENAAKAPQYEQKHLTEFAFCNFYSFYEEIARWIPDGGTWVEIGLAWGESFRWGVCACLNEGKNVRMVGVDAFPDAWHHNGTPMEQMFHNHMQPLSGHYETIRAESSEAAAHFADGTVDFVFIDANHTAEFVRRDVLAWLPKVKKGGIIAGHDYNPPHEVKQVVDEIFGTKVVPIPSDDFDAEHRPFYSWKVQL